MKDLIVSNHAIGNREELDRIWNEHGYWFFRDVLDHEALQRLKDKYMAELKLIGAVDQHASEPIWNGAQLEDVPPTFRSLHQLHAWQNFVKEPKIKAFFEEMLNDKIYWLPIDYYRLVAPTRAEKADPFIGVHQDGMSNPGLDFVVCWFPLTDITQDVGGIVLATGQDDRGFMDVVDGKAVFLDGPPIPDDSWARADYHLGDVLIFSKMVPHFGLGNTSDRFRISLDIRAVRRSGRLPVVGKVLHISPDEVTIQDEVEGKEITLRIDDETFCRGPGYPNPTPISRSEVAGAMPPGNDVLATRDGDVALILRPQMS